LLEDLDRIEQLVAVGTDAQRTWFAEWRQRFVDAADRGDDRGCEDLCDILIVYERTELRPPKRCYTVEELIDLLGFDRADFQLPTCDGEHHDPPVASPGLDGVVHHVCPRCGQTLLVEPLRDAAKRLADEK
jgi:hypothetical protein